MPNPSKDDPLFRVQDVEREMLATAILYLPDKERLVLTLYYYEELTTEQLEFLLGEVESSVSQIHTSACRTFTTGLLNYGRELTKPANW